MRTTVLACLIVCAVVSGLAGPAWAQEAPPPVQQARPATGGYVTPMADRLPYGYYPYDNELEFAFDPAAELVRTYLSDELLPAAQVAETSPGLAYAYFENPKWSWNSDMPDFGPLTPVKSGVTGNFTFEIPGKMLGWGMVYAGYLEVPRDGVYTFNVRPYSKCRLFIDGRLVLDTVRASTRNWLGAAAGLQAGKHEVAAAVLSWGEQQSQLPAPEMVRISGPGMPRQAVWDSMLSHSDAQAARPSAPAVARAAKDKAGTAAPAAAAGLREIGVEVLPVAGGEAVARGRLALDADGKGQGAIRLPDLPDGEYSVDYLVAGTRIRSPISLTRERFAWEGNSIGIEHKVYPPFVRVMARGNKVSVVGRTYRMNAFGLLDSAISEGKELLAGPMRLVCETAGGPLEWTVLNDSRGHAPYVDEARFTGAAACDAATVRTRSTVQEDGCVETMMEVGPGRGAEPVQRMWLEIVMKDADADLCHLIGVNAMRYNYGGKTPRGGRVVWQLDGGHVDYLIAPVTWHAEPGPSDGVIWDSTNVITGRPASERAAASKPTWENLAPYIWLGSGDRGLCWFTGDDRGYVNDGKQPVQMLSREGDKVVLRVYLIRQPTAVREPITFRWGLQASPTKPMRRDWRSHPVPGGGGLPVFCWGGYWCADKYPDNRDFSIVDRMQQVRRAGKHDEASKQFFQHKQLSRWWDDLEPGGQMTKVPAGDDLGRGRESVWLTSVMGWYAANCAYIEEHSIMTREPEWEVFQDEWAGKPFNRFQDGDAAGYIGSTSRSYRDFCLYYANEWLKRGVSVYFDNTFNKVDTNHHSNGFVGRTFAIWSQRDYYRRIFKTLSLYNEQGLQWPLDFTLHMTNTQILPFTTWCTGTLDLEQPYRRDRDGTELPFPAGYTLAVTSSRSAGAVPHVMYPLRNIGKWTDRTHTPTELQNLSSWGMSVVHELRGGWDRQPNNVADRFDGCYHMYGYARPDVEVHNYWDEKPPVTVGDERVKWIALTRKEKPACLLVLQSYAPQAVSTKVRVGPAGKVMMDSRTRQVLTADASGEAAIELPADYGTRMFFLAAAPADLPPVLARTPRTVAAEDFESYLGDEAVISPWQRAVTVQPQADDPANHVLRMTPSHPSQSNLTLRKPSVSAEQGYEYSLRVRLPGLGEPVVEEPLFFIRCGEFHLNLGVKLAKDGKACWTFGPLRSAPASAATNLMGQALEGVPVDSRWHRLTVRVSGARCVLSLDEKVIFDGEPAVAAGGEFGVACGFGFRGANAPFVEADDIRLDGLDGPAPR